MRIKSIEVVNDDVLGTTKLDFTGANGKALDTIIFAGENGVGKTRVLNLIYEFSEFRLRNLPGNQKRIIVTTLSEEEQSLLIERGDEVFSNGIQEGELVFEQDFSKPSGNWSQIDITFRDSEGVSKTTHGGVLANTLGGNAEPLRHNILKAIYSDVEINFSPNNISSVTAKDVDAETRGTTKSNQNLATEIAQLLVDVDTLDSNEITKWVLDNPGTPCPSEIIESRRIVRFTEAFEYIFPTKKYIGIETVNEGKHVAFEENGRKMFIKELSSGEKQIVFRGSFLLKDKKSNQGAIVLIDEPEISLHPRWQLKILEFYKRLFTDSADNQSSQIFIATHSPFVIHNANRGNDKVIILRRDSGGNTVASTVAEYFGWTPELQVAEAFNIDWEKSDQPLLITEGKTDAQILKTAWSKLFGTDVPFEILSARDTGGGAELVRQTLQLASNIISNRKVLGLFDNDRKGYEQFNGIQGFNPNTDGIRKHPTKDIYGLLLPAPSFRSSFVNETSSELRYLEIEHLFGDELLASKGLKGVNLFGTEIFEISGNKTSFAESCNELDAAEFENFRPVFEKITSLFNSE